MLRRLRRHIQQRKQRSFSHKTSRQRKLRSELLEDRRLLAGDVQQILFEDDFESGVLGNDVWATLVGTPTIMSESDSGGPINAWGNRALNLDAGWLASPPNDQVITKSFNLNSFASAQLKYRVQAEGQGHEPGAGDDLLVQYSVGSGWQTIRQNTNADTNNASFNTRYFDIPASAMQGIAFRFLNLGDYFQHAPLDDWFIDDVQLTAWRPHVTISDATVTEGNAANFTVQLVDDAGNPIAVTKPITVNYSVEASGTETDHASAADFTPRAGSLTFSPGQSSKSITVTTVQDTIDELSETFRVRLTSSGTRAEIIDSEGIGTITDNDPTPQVTLSVAGQPAGVAGHVSEGDSITFDVTLDRQSSRPVTVNYVTQFDSASVDDLTAVSGTVTFLPDEFAPGEQPLKKITVSIEQDDIDEPSESFSIQLSSPSNALLSQFSHADASIIDDDATPTVSISSASGIEGDAASSPLVFHVTLSNPSSVPITVDYATASQTASTGEDFAGTSGALTFVPGAVSQSFTVGLIPDEKDEQPSEQFGVSLSNPSSASIGVGQATGTILDDDASPVPALDLAIYRVDEGPGGLLPELQIDASATSDADSSNLTYRWDVGNDGQIDRVSTQPIVSFNYSDLAVLGLNDGPLQSQIRLEVSDGVNVSEALAALVVENSAPFVALSNNSVQLPPQAGGVLRESITIDDLSLSEAHTITVDYGDGTPPNTITLPPGVRSTVLEHTFAFPGMYDVNLVVSDGYEPDSFLGHMTVDVALGSSLPVVSFDLPNQSVNEGEDGTQITATLSLPPTESVTVPLIVTGDTDSGFTLSAQALEFDPGQTTTTIEIFAFADGLFEPPQQLRILMGTPTGAQLGDLSSHDVTIVSVDPLPTVDFANHLTTLPEGTVGALTATLDFPSVTDVVVPLSFSGSATATDYENFSFSGSEIIIPAGATSASKTLLIRDDELAEVAQALHVSMGLPAGALPGVNQVATFLIPANDTPIVDFRAAAIRVDEASGTSNVVVDLTNPILQTLSVPFTISGTATDGLDFSFSPEAPLMFQPGQTSAAIDLTVIDDLLVEPSNLESVVIRFEQPSVGVLGNTSAFELLIADNDFQTIQFVLDRQTIDEDSGVITFEVVSNRIADSDISIPVSVVFDSMDPSDLAGTLPTEVILPAGFSQTSFTVEVSNDVVNESNESFTVRLGTPSGGGELGEKDFQQVVVQDDDPIVLVSVEEGSFDEVTRGIDFMFQLTAPTNKDVVLDFDTFGEATLGDDYTLSHPGTITIPAGERTGRVTAFVRSDAVVETDETLGLVLTDVSNAVVQPGVDRASLLLKNNDEATVRFTTAASSFDEGESFRVRVSLSKPVPEDVTIPIKSIGGSRSAKPTADYWLFGLGRYNTVTIPAGQQTAYFSIAIRDDRFIEGRETINLQLGQPSSQLVSLDASLLKLHINASDKPLQESVTINPGGLGLNEPGVILLDANEVPGAGRDLAYVLETPDGEAIQVLPADVEKMIQAGQINVVAGGGAASPSAGQSTSLAIPSGTLAFDANGLSFSSVDPAQVASLSQISDLASAPGTVAPMTIIVDTGNGNFAGSTVFFDSNFNGVADFFDLNGDGIQQIGEPTEPTAKTDLDGSVDLQLSSNLDVNGDGRIDPQDGRLVLQGGFDTATELPMPLQMLAAVGHYSLSPLSTLAAKLVYELGFSSTSAEFQTLMSFGIEGGKFSDRFVVQSAAEGDPSGARMAMANAQLQSTAIGIASLFGALPGAPALVSLGDLVYSDMADKIREGGTVLDLSSEVTVESIVRGIEFRIGVSPAPSNRLAAVKTIAESNQRLGALDVSAADFLQQRAKIEVVAIGQLAPALSSMSAGTMTDTELLNAFTGASLQARIAAAEYGIINPPKVSVSSYKTFETDAAGTLRFEVQVEGEVTRPVEVTYETVLDDAVSGEVTPVSGTLTWQPGDNAPRIIEVPFTGDTFFEDDEAVLLALTSVENAVLKNDLGIAFLLNDDNLNFNASSDTASNKIHLIADADEAQLFQNDNYVFGGFFSEGAVAELHGAAGVADHLLIDVGAENSFLNGGLTFNGSGDAGDTIEVNAPLASSIVHRINFEGTGTFQVDGQTIAYAGVSQATHSLETRIEGLPARLKEGDAFVLNALHSAGYPTSGVTYNWTQKLNGSIFRTGSESDFLVELPVSGSMEISLQVNASGLATTTRVLVLDVENLAPTITMDLEPISIVEGTSTSRFIEIIDVSTDSIDVTASLGSVSETGSGTWEWSYTGEDDLPQTTVTILAEDSDEGRSAVQFLLSVENAVPQIVVDTTEIIVDEGSVATRTVLSQDVSADSVTLTASLGILTSNASGGWVWTYEPEDDHTTQHVVFTATDDDQGVSTASISVSATNQAPTLSFDDSSVVLDEGSQTSKQIAAADVAADTIMVSASLGSIAEAGNSIWVWEYEAADDLPNTTVVIRAQDEDGGVRERSFQLSVDNVVPSLSDYVFEIGENSGLGAPVGRIEALDPGSDAVHYQIDGGNEHGTFAMDPVSGQITIQNTARLDYEVPEFRVSHLQVRARDDDGGASTATVIITITDQNDAPLAIDVTGATGEDGPNTTVAADFSDVDANDTHSFSINTSGTLGSVVNHGDGTFTYDPNGAFESLAVNATATDAFTYTVDDGNGGLSTATVSIAITGQNDAPQAVDVTGDTVEDGPNTTVAADFSDVDASDTHSFSINTSGTLGSVVNHGDGTFTYDPNGAFESLAVNATATDTFTYTVDDGNGGLSTATVSIAITGQNDAPQAVDVTGNTVEDGPNTTVAADFNDVDANDIHGFSINSSGTLGSVINHGDGTFTYDPNGAFEFLAVNATATDTFTYTVDDGNGGLSTATVSIAITGQNDAPQAVDVTGDTVEDGPNTTVAADFSDMDASDTHSFSINTSGTLGSVVNHGDGTFTYDPNGAFDHLAFGEFGSDSFTYTVIDDQGGMASAEAVITISGLNDAPTQLQVFSSNFSTANASEDGHVSIDATFSDVDLSDAHVAFVDWGDGSDVEAFAVEDGSHGFSRTHHYASGGLYPITVTVEDSREASILGSSQAAVQGSGIVGETLYIIGTDQRDDVDLEQRWYYDGSGAWWKWENWVEFVRVDAKLDGTHSRSEYPKTDVTNIEIYVLDGKDKVEVGRHIDRPATLYLGEGDDRAEVKSGMATVYAGPGNDRVETGPEDDFVDGEGGHDQIETGPGNDTVRDLQGNNRIESGPGNDSVTTGDGDDRVDSGDGDDLVTAGGGDDRVDLGDGNDIAWLGAGNDRADGGEGDDIVFGEAGDDRIDGGRGNDVLVGGDGEDRMDGERGLDLLIGGWGADRLDGGKDDDLLIAGWTTYDANAEALQRILVEWSSEQDYATRVANLRTGSGPGLENSRLKVGETVFDDGAEDRLDGQDGRDWFFGSLEDEIKRKRSNELLDLL